MIAVNSEDFYYSCYSNLSPCFSGLGYCRNSNLLMLVLLILRVLFKTVAGAVVNSNRIALDSPSWITSVCIISRGIPVIWIKSRCIILLAMLMVPVKQVTETTIQERFIVCFICCVLRKACIIYPLGIEGF